MQKITLILSVVAIFSVSALTQINDAVTDKNGTNISIPEKQTVIKSININGQKIEYTTTSGYLSIKNEAGEELVSRQL